MSPITPRRFQEIEELSRYLFPEEEGGQHQLSEDRRLAILGVAELRMLGYWDSGMAGTPANKHPEAFVNAERVEAAGKLVRIIR